jgi:DNA-binding PadR family transcriptional regulator
MLEDEGCVTSQTIDGKRIYTITEAGRALLAQKPAESADQDGEHWESRHELKDSAMRLGAAVWQAAREGDPGIMSKVRDVLDRARREVYAILGGDSV